jgi:hypothetical protein
MSEQDRDHEPAGTEPYPSLDEFLAGPVEQVAKVAPPSIVFAPGGTRRDAVFAGLPAQGDDYARWHRTKMLDCFGLMFDHGIQHIFMALLIEKQYKEKTPDYKERIIDWIDWGISGEESLADYDRRGWRVRLLYSEIEPRLRDTAHRLEAQTPSAGDNTVWFFLGVSPESILQRLVAAIEETEDRTHEGIVHTMYGEHIPPATLYLAFGKPSISLDLLPPLLTRDLQCYWSQRPSFSLSERQLRTILYDYAYVRPTWREDKTGRAEKALAYRSAWERGPTIGLGVRLGPFWYPAPFEMAESSDGNP